MMIHRKKLSSEQALQKLKHYCAYQERCHLEVRLKLASLGVWRKEEDEIIATLITENYLNEERFAIAFARGKFRIKHWGRHRIIEALRQKGINHYCIRKAVGQLEANDYDSSIRKLADKKFRSLKDESSEIRKKKTTEYLLRKGYERAAVIEALRGLGIR